MLPQYHEEPSFTEYHQPKNEKSHTCTAEHIKISITEMSHEKKAQYRNIVNPNVPRYELHVFKYIERWLHMICQYLQTV